ncbi:UNVERIFIED_CONTAM: hypothetical protein PYX00_004525 [Menopon gallinae]|uniref:RUN domain-containing protein n=1 Tax=Menopon gallinae TaxID=328185 RepID=A0AAW2I5U7_9NEOP
MMQSLRQKKIQVTESLIKESLLRQLSYSVKEVQLQYSQTNEIFSTNEACNSLIVVLEAIFLHGIKKGIFRTALKTVSGMEESRPQPSFWAMACAYTHKDTVQTIKKLSQINTDVGRCRVWLRIALNEAGITSYFQAMEKDRRPVNSSYNNYAFLRDRETCDTASKLLEGIVSVEFKIPINANILNYWNTEPLILSGVWSPPLKIPLSNAIDVAEGLEADTEEDDTCSIRTSSSVTTLSTILALDENQALKIILETPIKRPEKESIPTPAPVNHSDEVILEEGEGEENHVPSEDTQCIGNSISNSPGWSSGDCETSDVQEEQPVKEEPKEVVKEEPKTFSGLLESYGHSPNDEKNYKSILQQISEKQTSEELVDTSDFEVCQSQDSNFEGLLFKIVREKGLKAQKYTCVNCQLSIGLNFDEARYCYFTGKYYCRNCHLNEVAIIPSRLVYNWDHKKYQVCAAAHSYLSDISSTYLINVKEINPKIYGVVSEMQELRTMRFRLNLLRAYLYTCREPVILELQKKVWPRDYLYENIHTYTLSDLYKVPGGTLASELNAVITHARDHVLNCWLCSQKGFICEVCRNPKVIYPFDCGSTYRCSKCYSVYHEGCLSSSKNCPKCKRLKKRVQPENDIDDGSD